jgi:hypothetical protein
VPLCFWRTLRAKRSNKNHWDDIKEHKWWWDYWQVEEEEEEEEEAWEEKETKWHWQQMTDWPSWRIETQQTEGDRHQQRGKEGYQGKGGDGGRLQIFSHFSSPLSPLPFLHPPAVFYFFFMRGFAEVALPAPKAREGVPFVWSSLRFCKAASRLILWAFVSIWG